MVNNNYCPCSRLYNDNATYLVDFGANIAIPTGGTVGAISIAYAVDGGTDQASTMIVTPAAVEEFFNVSRSKEVDIFSKTLRISRFWFRTLRFESLGLT